MRISDILTNKNKMQNLKDTLSEGAKLNLYEV